MIKCPACKYEICDDCDDDFDGSCDVCGFIIDEIKYVEHHREDGYED